MRFKFTKITFNFLIDLKSNLYYVFIYNVFIIYYIMYINNDIKILSQWLCQPSLKGKK